MKEKILKLSTGENIYVYDDVFDAHECEYFNLFAQNSLYRCWNSSVLHETMTYGVLTCTLDNNDIQNFKFFESKNFQKIKNNFENMKIERSWITLCKHSDEIYYHCDDRMVGHKSLLYYINNIWNLNNGGETLFCNSQGEVELAISSKPNRVVIFDSHLQHKPSGLSRLSPPNRFSFVSVFCK